MNSDKLLYDNTFHFFALGFLLAVDHVNKIIYLLWMLFSKFTFKHLLIIQKYKVKCPWISRSRGMYSWIQIINEILRSSINQLIWSVRH